MFDFFTEWQNVNEPENKHHSVQRLWFIILCFPAKVKLCTCVLTVIGDFTYPGSLTASLFINHHASEHKHSKEPEANISSQQLLSYSHILNPIIGSTVGGGGSGFPQELRVSCVPLLDFFFFFWRT